MTGQNMALTDVKLHRNENPWRPRINGKPRNPEDAKTQEVFRMLKGILNKVTPEKFQTLLQEALNLDPDTEERLEGCADIIFEQAIRDPKQSLTYAYMCKNLINWKVPSRRNPCRMALFKVMLLNRCQKEFETDIVRFKEKDSVHSRSTAELIASLNTAQSIAKKRSLGTARFLGELFKIGLLTKNVIHDCLEELLACDDEAALECFCVLISTLGNILDGERSTVRMDMYFTRVGRIVNYSRISSRVRFMLLEVSDVRRNKWVPRREAEHPATIQQIHREARGKRKLTNPFIPSCKKQMLDAQYGTTATQFPRPIERYDRQTDGRANLNMIDPAYLGLVIKISPGDVLDSDPDAGIERGKGDTNLDNRKLPEAVNTVLPINDENCDRRAHSEGIGGADGRNSLERDGRFFQERERDNCQEPGPGQPAVKEEKGDRTSALGTVSNMTACGVSQSEHGYIGVSRNQVRAIDPPEGEVDLKRPTPGPVGIKRPTPRMLDIKPVSPTEELLEAELKKITEATMDAHLHQHDLNKAMCCVKALESRTTIHVFVYHALSLVQELSETARSTTGTLLQDLVVQNIIPVDQYTQGLKEYLEFVEREDIDCTIPRIWENLAKLICPMVVIGAVPLRCMRDACAPLVRTRNAEILLGELLNDLCDRLGPETVGDLWRKSGQRLSDFLPSGESTPHFCTKYGLGFIQDQSLRIDSYKNTLDPARMKLTKENVDITI